MPASDHGQISDDELDRLFSYNFGGSEDVRDGESPINAAEQKRNGSQAVDDDGLGIDREVGVGERKKRQPLIKLDSTLLTGPKGIPKLRSTAKKQLRFRGKGHEFSDTARLLNMYQLWLDGLFPKAKFDDGLAMVEKLGHTKSLQVMRKQWIDEERCGKRDSDLRSTSPTAATPRGRNAVSSKAPSGNNTSAADAPGSSGTFEPPPIPTSIPHRSAAAQLSELDIPDEDELDALMGETPGFPAGPVAGKAPVPDMPDEFEAEMEAMAEMEELYG